MRTFGIAFYQSNLSTLHHHHRITAMRRVGIRIQYRQIRIRILSLDPDSKAQKVAFKKICEIAADFWIIFKQLVQVRYCYSLGKKTHMLCEKFLLWRYSHFFKTRVQVATQMNRYGCPNKTRKIVICVDHHTGNRTVSSTIFTIMIM